MGYRYRRPYGQSWREPSGPQFQRHRGETSQSSNEDLRATGLQYGDDGDDEVDPAFEHPQRYTQAQRSHNARTLPYSSTPCPDHTTRGTRTYKANQNRPDLFPNHQSRTTMRTPPPTYRGPQTDTFRQRLKFGPSLNLKIKDFENDLSSLCSHVNQCIQNMLERLPGYFEDETDDTDGLDVEMDWQYEPCVVIPAQEEVHCYRNEGERGGGEGEDSVEDCERMGRISPTAMGNPEMRRRASTEGNHVFGSHRSHVYLG